MLNTIEYMENIKQLKEFLKVKNKHTDVNLNIIHKDSGFSLCIDTTLEIINTIIEVLVNINVTREREKEWEKSTHSKLQKSFDLAIDEFSYNTEKQELSVKTKRNTIYIFK